MYRTAQAWIADRMNALAAYFADTGDNLAKLAERIGRSPSTITRPLRGERNVSMNVAREIEHATGGRVSAAQFVAICLEMQKRTRAANDAAGGSLGQQAVNA